MLFESVHIVNKGRNQFTENKPPKWLILDCEWFFVERVKTLKIGDKVRSEFYTIKRIA